MADSRAQCLTRGEIHHGLRQSVADPGDIVELGEVIAGDVAGRVNDQQVTVADLTVWPSKTSRLLRRFSRHPSSTSRSVPNWCLELSDHRERKCHYQFPLKNAAAASIRPDVIINAFSVLP